MKNDLNVDQIKKLWILDKIIESGSFKGAAAQAKITPSAVSQSLTALEKNVGKPLVIRNKGSVTPTQDALTILEIVRPAFDVFNRLNELGSQPVPQMSWLNFGTYESLAVDLLPGLVHRLKESLPNLRLGLRISRTDSLLTMVRKGELCSAVVTEVDDLDRFYNVNVASDRLGFYVSNKHPIAQKPWDAALTHGIGSLAPGKQGLPRYYVRFLKQLGKNKPTILSDSFETLRAATASGMIASVLPQRVARRLDDLKELHPPKAAKEDGRHSIYVISQLNCDREEANFLANEVSRLLGDDSKLSRT